MFQPFSSCELTAPRIPVCPEKPRMSILGSLHFLFNCPLTLDGRLVPYIILASLPLGTSVPADHFLCENNSFQMVVTLSLHIIGEANRMGSVPAYSKRSQGNVY